MVTREWRLVKSGQIEGLPSVPLKNKDRSPLPGPQLRGLSALMAGQRPRGFAAHVGSSSVAERVFVVEPPHCFGRRPFCGRKDHQKGVLGGSCH
jgi:hypothetical protein